MRFLVMGAGSIGSVIGGLLSEGNHEVCLLGRDPHIETIVRSGLEITGIWGDRTVTDIMAVTTPGDVIVEGFEPEWIILSVKSYDTDSALCDLRPVLSEARGIISLQNGLGNVEAIERTVPGKTVGGRVIFGATTIKPGSVNVTVCADDVLMGPVRTGPTGIESVCESFAASGIPCRYESNIVSYIWDKVLYNVCLNALATVLGCSYGELGDDPETKKIIEYLTCEFYEVANAEHVETVSESPGAYLERLKNLLLPPTREHRSSMQEDILKGRRTEIDALNGAVWNLGLKHGIKTPVNETLTRLIHHLESQS
ncbi:MAG: ketopantoate reductase family protein [Actinobacteria bacterium]|nr:ketopantoate reductase family protein [Actinomycetota bacterium]